MIVLLTAVGIYQVNKIDRDLTTINDINGTKQRFAVDMRGSVHDRAIVLRDVVITAGNGNLGALESQMQRLRDAYSAAETGMQQVTSQYAGTAQEQSIINSINEQAVATQEMTAQVVSARQADNYGLAQRLVLEQAGPAYNEWLNRINQFINLQQELNDATTATARDTASGFEPSDDSFKE